MRVLLEGVRRLPNRNEIGLAVSEGVRTKEADRKAAGGMRHRVTVPPPPPTWFRVYPAARDCYDRYVCRLLPLQWPSLHTC